jgi:hypothetical protein
MCSTLAPSTTRPTSVQSPLRRSGLSGAAFQMRIVGLGNQNPRGITPTMVRAWPPRRSWRPIIDGWPPSSCHSP